MLEKMASLERTEMTKAKRTTKVRPKATVSSPIYSLAADNADDSMWQADQWGGDADDEVGSLKVSLDLLRQSAGVIQGSVTPYF